MQNLSRSSNEERNAPIDPSDFILVSVNESKSRVEVHIRGEILSPQYATKQLGTLYELSERYDTVLYYINTPGGVLSTLTEFLSVNQKFKTVITVGCGCVASAGFSLWASGDIRVTQSNTIFMCHRESFVFAGKTPQHLEIATFNDQLFSVLSQELFGDILTEQEIEKSKTTEVYVSDKELIRRNTCIDWKKFITRDNLSIQSWTQIEIDNEVYDLDGDICIAADGSKHLYTDLLFDLPYRKVISDGIEQEEQIVVNTM